MPGAALARKMSRTLQRMLVHSYSRSTVTVSDTVNAWGAEEVTAGTGTSGLRCLYGSETRIYGEPLSRDDLGARTTRVPTLFVAPDDTLAVGDVVTDVLDAAGNVLVAGPLVVESITLNAEAGLSVLKSATLRGTVQRAVE